MTVAPIVCRSILFVPGNRPDRFGKALNAGSDAVCFDLEDAVAPDAKAAGREQIRTFLETSAPSGVARIVRINDIASIDGLRDLLAVSEGARVDAVWLPKVESAAVCVIARAALGGDQAPAIIALIETVVGLRDIHAIATTPGVTGLVFGSADYCAQVGCAMTSAALAVPRSMVVQAAAGAGIVAYDGAWLDLQDDDGLARDAAEGAMLGFVGKPALHPRQVAAINAAFSPSSEQLERARGIVRVSTEAGGGVAVFAGRMLDAPIVRMAERVLAAYRPEPQ